ncbi:MAG: transcription antitermination factor NusB [Lachnospiraceae bacterium]|jgi:N utilization substance protein B|nr:transcription antitermination factor NusB [Lachnospiraceae bacterium]
MGRRELREQIFKLLFRVEFHEKEDMPEQLVLFLEEAEEEMTEQEERYIAGKYEKIKEKLSELDDLLNSRTEKWTTDRIGKAELTILRLAVYEILFDEEVPVGVAINEAVELAKKFGQDSAKAFVNGVLAKFADKG